MQNFQHSVNSENVDSRPLVEFFFAKGYENVTEMLEGMDGIVNTIHWRLMLNKKAGLAIDDANIRAGQLGVFEYPAIVINESYTLGNTVKIPSNHTLNPWILHKNTISSRS